MPGLRSAGGAAVPGSAAGSPAGTAPRRIDDLKLGLAAVAVLAERYLLRDERGRVTESTGQMMDRAAACVAEADEAWRPGSAARWAEKFAGALRRLEFMPNSPR